MKFIRKLSQIIDKIRYFSQKVLKTYITALEKQVILEEKWTQVRIMRSEIWDRQGKVC